MQQDKLWDFHQTQATSGFAGSRARLEWIALQFIPGQRVLNIGVGAGTFEAIAMARGIDIHALDPSEATIAQLRARLNIGDKAQTGRAEQLPFADDFFDGVVVSEVLEHLTDDILNATLAEIRRTLKRGGQLVGTVPNEEDLDAQTVVCPDCGKVFHRWGHVRRFDQASMHSTLKAFFPEPRTAVRLFIAWETLNWKGRIIAFGKQMLFALGVHGRDENLVFTAVRQ